MALVPILWALLAFTSIGCGSVKPELFESSSEKTIDTPSANFSSARVVKVLDGATIIAESGGNLFTVRYLGIDSLDDQNVPGATDRSLQFNRFLVGGKLIELEAGLVSTDPQGRLLRYVYVDGEMVNQALLANGHATVATYPNEFSLRDHFEEIEANAHRDRRGFWGTEEHKSDNGSNLPPDSSFKGGTLPAMPSTALCDYSNSLNPVIKGNVDSRTGDHIYHVPEGFFYSSTVIDPSKGDIWLCTEEQATASGWRRSKH